MSELLMYTEWCYKNIVSEYLTDVFSLPFVCVADLRKQMESSELRNQRLKEVFQRKIQEFRTVCYVLTGYQMDITTENQYRLTSVYAEHMDDSLLFKKVFQRDSIYTQRGKGDAWMCGKL